MINEIESNKTSKNKVDRPIGSNVPDYIKFTPSEKQSLTSGGTHGILDKERSKVSFKIQDMTDDINGGKDATKRRKFIESMVTKDLREAMNIYNHDRSESLSHSVKDFIRIHKPYKNFRPTRMDLAYMSMASTCMGSLTNSHSIFLSTLMGMASEEQVEFWGKKALAFEICGSYAQTELGHGSNIRGLQTTAEYDKNTEEFILNTPTLQSIKWWPGTLGKVGTHCVLFAQLIINGKEHGLNVFILQIRDENHKPLPGIRLGDLGTKIGDNANDTGFMILDNVRIPREYMFCKFRYVTKEGEYVNRKDVDQKVVYSTMITTRAMMTLTAGTRLAQASTIAARYSIVRKQGFKETAQGVSYKTDEHSIIDHKIQRYRIFKQIAFSYVIFFAGRWIVDFISQAEGNNAGIVKDTSLLKELLGTSAGMKSLCTYLTTLGIEDLRKSCGGNGYLLNSGIAALATDYLWQVTAEGDYTILGLLTSIHIIKSIGKVFGGEKVQGLMSYFNVISEEDFSISKIKPAPAQKAEEFFNIDYLLDLFRYKSLEKNTECAMEFNKRLTKKGESFEKAFTSIADELIKGCHSHCHYSMFKMFDEKIKKTTNPELKKTFEKLAVVYALTNFIDDNWGEVINGNQYKLIKQCLDKVLDELRPDAIGLVDSFDFPDTVLKSTIGRYDGNIYEALFDEAQRSTLNQTDPFDGYKHLEPHLDKELLKRRNAPVLKPKF